MSPHFDIIVAGGGAAGFFAALSASDANPRASICILEKTSKTLSKVAISGGGRCNVTHNCRNHEVLAASYPRGGEFLKQLFPVFDCGSTVDWFRRRGVKLKTEADGRMFPVTDESQTITDCFARETRKNGIRVLLGEGIASFQKTSRGFLIHASKGSYTCSRLIICSGGSAKERELQWLKDAGLQTVSPCPSLFTFNLPGASIRQLQGLSLEKAKATFPKIGMSNVGPLLITHWGLSGPAVIKLSALAARELEAAGYETELEINFLPGLTKADILEKLRGFAASNPKKQILSLSPFQEIPLRLWKFLAEPFLQHPERNWAESGKKLYEALASTLTSHKLNMKGKTTFKEEFVTCGGLSLEELNPQTMECVKIPGLYFAGEILDIDGITGGFNFQAAWTTGFVAGRAAAQLS